MAATPGHIYVHHKYYRDRETQAWLPKFLLILATPPKSDLVYRLLTSKQHSRPFDPCCYHGAPLPGYYLGEKLCNRLPDHSWLDLRRAPDFDTYDFGLALRDGEIEFVMNLAAKVLRPALQCAAAADDTTVLQEKHILDCMAGIPP